VNRSTFLRVTAVIYIISGIAAILVPARQLAPMAWRPTRQHRRWPSGAGLGSVVVGLLARSAQPGTNRSLLLTLLVYFVVAAGLSLVGTLSRTLSAPGWLLLAFNVFLAGCYTYLLATAPPDATRVS
jgi:uncharacterized membrane protein HdeD (DUF308 family)